MGLRDFEHLRADIVVGNQHVSQKHEERLSRGFLRRTMDGMAQSERFVLVYIRNIEIARMLYRIREGVFALRAKRCDQLRVGREMLLDGSLLATVDNHHFVSPRRKALFDHVLDGRTVDDEQHLFRLCFRGRKETRAHARCGNQSLHACLLSIEKTQRPEGRLACADNKTAHAASKACRMYYDAKDPSKTGSFAYFTSARQHALRALRVSSRFA